MGNTQNNEVAFNPASDSGCDKTERVAFVGGMSPSLTQALASIRETEDNIEAERLRGITIPPTEECTPQPSPSKVVLVVPPHGLGTALYSCPRSLGCFIETKSVGEKIYNNEQRWGKKWKKRNLKLTKTRNGWK